MGPIRPLSNSCKGKPGCDGVLRRAGVASQVSVVYTAPLLGQVVTPVGVQSESAGWQPSQTMLTADQLQALLKGGATNVALRFTATTGTSNIDDVFIDPRMGWR